jgi:hypothetical protein
MLKAQMKSHTEENMVKIVTRLLLLMEIWQIITDLCTFHFFHSDHLKIL